MKQNRTPMPNKNNQRKWLLPLLGLLFAALVIGGLYYFHHQQSQKLPPVSDTINYRPPTKEEQSAGDKQKQADLDQQNATPPSKASVFISDAAQYDGTVEVRAYVSNVVEDGGTCTTTFTKGSTSFSVTNTAFRDASSTQCGAIDVARSRFSSAGQWQVLVKYSSAAISGQSEISNVTVN